LVPKIAGEIKGFRISDELLSPKDADHFDLFIHYALHSTHEAMEQAGLLGTNVYPQARMGCILGVGLGGLPFIEDTHQQLLEKGPRRVSPFFIPSNIANLAPGLIPIKLGLRGSNFAVTSAC